jgi:hypothetical protein
MSKCLSTIWWKDYHFCIKISSTFINNLLATFTWISFYNLHSVPLTFVSTILKKNSLDHHSIMLSFYISLFDSPIFFFLLHVLWGFVGRYIHIKHFISFSWMTLLLLYNVHFCLSKCVVLKSILSERMQSLQLSFDEFACYIYFNILSFNLFTPLYLEFLLISIWVIFLNLF